MNGEQRGSRRHFLKVVGGATLLGGLGPWVAAPTTRARSSTLTKAIPKSGEPIPVIGMGTSRTFDVGPQSHLVDPLVEVTRAFFDGGGRLIDSSPMYGEAEEVVGQILKRTQKPAGLFAATKVWIDGRQEGVEQMENSRGLWGVERFDLMQIHNLRDWQLHLPTLRDMKARGRLRYLGFTTSHGRFHGDLAKILATEDLDFVQLSYNILDREVEKRLLPLAQEEDVAVIVNRPFQRGELFRKVKGRPLPAWAREIDCTSWGQIFLKFAVSHPAVTCAIPATSKKSHMIDNMGASRGRLPDAALRKRMIETVESL